MKAVLSLLPMAGLACFFCWKLGDAHGFHEELQRQGEERRKEIAERCCRGETRPCVFGPGIVGVQECGFFEWRQCEPDPRFRVPPEGSAK